jgi:hypothetical protein
MEELQTNEFIVNHIVTLYDYNKETEIFSIDIEFDGSIENMDLSNDLLKISAEIKKLPMDISFYKITKINESSYYLDFK